MMITALLVCLLFHGICVAVECSLIKLRYSHFNTDLLEKLREANMGWALDKADFIVKILRFGIVLSTVAFTLLTYNILKPYFGLLLSDDLIIGPLLAILIVIPMLVCVYFLIAELIPRGLGLQYPLHTLKYTIPCIRIFSFFVRPVFIIVTPVSRFFLRLFNVQKSAELDALDVESQLKDFGVEVPTMDNVLENVMKNTMQMKKLVVQDVLLPRNQVQFLDMYNSLEENLEVARRSGHTRFPLCEGDLDKCVGFIHIKDIFRLPLEQIKSVNLRRIKRGIIKISLEDPLEVALEILMRKKAHMALVVDDFGGTVGVLTLESILEELVGDIQDEFDYEEADIQQLSDGEYKVSGLTPIHDLEEELGIKIENDEVSTFGGLITSSLGRIPAKSENVQTNGMDITITEVDETRVISATVHYQSTNGTE